MYAHHIKQLSKFLGLIPVKKIHLGHLREYQRARTLNTENLWSKPCGPSIVNHEMVVVQQVLTRAGSWGNIKAHYEPLPLPAFQPQKVMTDEEEDRLFAIAATNPSFEIAFLVASLTNNTTAAGTELRNLQLRHVTLDRNPPRIIIPGDKAKNGYRGRVIALNTTAFEQMARCVRRAASLGSVQPDHYLFPFRVCKGKWDPTRPASTSWLKSSFQALRAAADLPWLTPHCLRHQAITKMLECGVPAETVRNVAGHVSDQMMRHYSHNRLSAQAEALASIDRRKRPMAVVSPIRRSA